MSNFVYTYIKDEMPKHLNFVLEGILPTCPTLFIPMSKMKCLNILTLFWKVYYQHVQLCLYLCQR